MIEITFNESEQKRLGEINSQKTEIFNAISQGKIDFKNIVTATNKLSREFRAIKEQATRRTLQAYASQPEKILDDIREDIQRRIHTREAAPPSPDLLELHNFAQSLNVETKYRLFLEWLQENSPKLFDEAMNMIENAFSKPENKNALLPVATVYSKILQGKGTNALAHVSKKDFTVDSFSKTGKATTDNDVFMQMEHYSERLLSAPARQLLDAMLIELTDKLPHEELTDAQIHKYRQITVKLTDFAKSRGISLVAARKQIEEILPMYAWLRIEFDEERKVIKKTKTAKGGWKKTEKQEKVHVKAIVISGTEDNLFPENPIQNGYVSFGFSFEFVKYLSRACITLLPNNILKINSNNNPHSYFLGRKLAVYYSINKHKGHKNANYIRVQNLLKDLPDMPTYKQVLKQGGHVRRHMIEPFTRDMNELINCGVLNFWHYCNSGGADITLEQREILNGNETRGVYEVWSKLLIHFELANYPNNTDAIDAEATEKTEPIKEKE